MSEEHDSWFKQAFGVDLGESVDKLKSEAGAVVEQVAQTAGQAAAAVQGAAHGAVGGLGGAVEAAGKMVKGAAQKVGNDAGGLATAAATAAAAVAKTVAGAAIKTAGAVAEAVADAAQAAGEAASPGSFPLKGSVGRGGGNAANDVSAVQRALGIAADGKCGPQTIGAIEAFQRRMGMSRPDGRVDAGGATERALAGGGAASAGKTAHEVPSESAGGGSASGSTEDGSIFERIEQGVSDAAGKVVSGVRKALEEPGVLLDDSEPADAGAGDAAPTDAGATDPTFVDIDKPFNVRADDPVDFVNRANEHMGAGAAAHMQTGDLSVAGAETDAKGKVVRSNLVVKTTTVRPHWIAGRPIGDEKVVIEQAEELIRGHEERHREIMKSGMRSAVKEMIGKSTAEADKILVKWMKTVDSQQDALDSREGKIEIIQSGGRMTGARLVPR